MGLGDELRKAAKRLKNRWNRTLTGRIYNGIMDALNELAQSGGDPKDARFSNTGGIAQQINQLKDELDRHENSQERGRHQNDIEYLQQELAKLGPVGHQLIGLLGRGNRQANEADVAAEVVKAFGGIVLDKHSGPKDLAQAAEFIRNKRHQESFQLAEEIQRARESATQIRPPFADEDQARQEDQEQMWSQTIFSPQSSNVYSIRYHYKKSTLYVVFKAPNVNSKAVKVYKGSGGMLAGAGDLGKTFTGGSRANEPGATYAYYDVPARIWQKMERASSKGTAVWDNLRIRGTVWGHKYRYAQVSAALAKGDDGRMFPVVHRRATKRGFSSRTVTTVDQTGRRSYTNATLPPQRGHVTRPNRGRPNRGRP